MDGWSALGAAAAIAQFIDFGCRLVSLALKTQKSTDGLTEQLREVRSVIERLQGLVDRLTGPDASEAENGIKDNPAIQSICDECRCIGTELLDIVHKVAKNDKDAMGGLASRKQPKKRSSFAQALRQVWNEDKVYALSNRLQSLRQELAIHLLAALSPRETGRPEFIGNEFIQTMMDEQEWRRILINTLQQRDLEDHLPMADVRHETVQYFEPSISAITRSLRYPGVMDRETSISAAHETTLQWIFRYPEPHGFQWTSFVDWLESDGPSNLYWVTGKAGSGKSTLIKYIHNHTLTKQALHKWSAKLPVMTSAFYFWNSGRPMQMSLLGLLQTLLLGILSQRPECIPLANRPRWEAHRLFGAQVHSWTQAEALEALVVAIQHSNQSSKICLFIDGLDEFKGKPEELIALVKGLLLPNVKVCVASRPWPVFRDAFGHGPSLILEHLNMPDIEFFVTNSLDDSAGFLELKTHDPAQAANLAHEITLRSSGVFLWVSLVVRSLLEDLARGDRLSDMYQTLEGLPTELESLFEVIITSLDQAHRRRLAEMFRIVGAACGPLSLSLFADADEENPQYAIDFEPKVLSPDQKLSRCLVMERRLNSYSKGLLGVKMRRVSKDSPEGRLTKINDAQRMLASLKDPEDTWDYVSEICNSSVEYLHRTIRDYLDRPAVRAQFVDWAGPSFYPECSLCSAFLLALKTIDPLSVTRARFWWPINRCLAYAAQFEAISGTTLNGLLNELDSVATRLSLSRTADNLTVWRSIAGVQASLHCNLYNHAQTLLQGQPLHQYEMKAWPLLSSAFMTYEPAGEDIPPSTRVNPPVGLVEGLLKQGASPNAPGSTNITPWQHVLRRSGDELCKARVDPVSILYWVEILALFVEYKANYGRLEIPARTWQVIESHSPDAAGMLRGRIRKRRAAGMFKRLSLLR
ncbi:hypothetical protein BDW71DRAFT_210634 [Aspergillus fruticulosus]